MKRRTVRGFTKVWARPFTALALVGACTVVDKGDYTFTDNPDDNGGTSGAATGGTAGSSSGNAGDSGDSGSSGSSGKGGTSGEGGDGNGGTTGGTSGEAGGGSGGGGGDDLCDPNPCDNGSRCIQTGDTMRCECGPGYLGPTCSEETDECDPNPCKNAACTDLVADFSCACPQHATGKTCELSRFQGIPAPMGVTGQAALARAVSADGTVVLGEFWGASGSTIISRPFIWSFEDGSRIVPVPSIIRADVTVKPWSISGDGTFWVGEFHNANMGSANPIGGPTAPPGPNQTLPMFGIPPNALSGNAFDTNQDGTRSVGNFTDGMNVVRALQFNEMGMSLPLPNPFGMSSPFSSAGAVTRDGTIAAGTVVDSTGGFLVNFWAESGATAPGQVRTMTGISRLEVHGVSANAARTAGTYSDTANSNFAFMTDGSRFVPISPIGGGTVLPRSNAWDISDDGNFVVGDVDFSTTSMGGSIQAVIWKTSDGMARTLIDVLRDSNVAPPNWQLLTAYGVSADGKVVVGSGKDPMGLEQGFIARLP